MLRGGGLPGNFPWQFSLEIPRENQFSPRLSIACAACSRRIGQIAKK
jgi:hypothetical protein